MISAADVTSWATYLGLTPNSLFPLVVVGGILFYYVYKLVNPIKKSITRITNACIEIQTIFENDGNGRTLHHQLVEAPGSPLSPTSLGKKYIQESGLEKILDEHGDTLKAELRRELPPDYTEYDVQELSRMLLVKKKEEAIMNPVKEYAYQNGLKLELILKVGGLWLRDDFLVHPRKVKSDESN